MRPVVWSPVDRALVELLDRECRAFVNGFGVELGRMPGDVDLDDPNYVYAIVFAVDRVGTGYEGPPAAPESDGEREYDVRCVGGLGAGRGRVQWCSDKVREVLFERSAWGAPENPIVVAGLGEMGRSLTASAGAATLVDDVWQSTDSIRLTVSREA